LAGKDDWEEAKATEYLMYQQEIGQDLMPYLGVKFGFRQGDAVSWK
jgi:hypothetical protein